MNIHRKLTALLLLLLNSIGITTAEKPNFIIIMADDLGYGDLGYTGSTQIKTPHIDKLAEDGVVFTNGYVTSPVCGPSRAGLITGRYNNTFGFYSNPDLPPDQQLQINREYTGLPIEEVTIADRLADLGYINGLIGKWHLGHLPPFHPLNRGFHEFWGYVNGGHDYFITMPRSETNIRYRWPIESNFKTQGALTYLTDDKGNECVDFIRRHKDQPFFLFASFNAPHIPLQALESDKELYSFIEDERRRTYCAMVHNLDVNVGKIINELKKQGLYESTVIVFLSDNGGYINDDVSINAPFRGEKLTLLEGGIHVPFFITYPERFEAGLVYEKPVIAIDILPTFVSLAGGEINPEDDIHGVDLTPFITGIDNSMPHEYLLWSFQGVSAIRHGDLKLIDMSDKFPMLFMLPDDPAEQNDIVDKEKDTAVMMLEKLGMWNLSCPKPLFFQSNRYRLGIRNLYNKPPLPQPKPTND